MKILCLIIDSDGPWCEVYEAHRRIWNAVLDKNPNVEGYFLRSDPNLAADHQIEGRRFVVRGEERYDTILAKTLKAVEVLLGDHDYVLRTNLSSLYDFPLLRRRALPAAGCYMGVSHNGAPVSGSGILLSPDVARKLLAPSRDLGLSGLPDDVAIGRILEQQGVSPIHEPRYDYDYGRGIAQIVVGTYIQYRLRGHYDDPRTREPAAARALFEKIYGTQT